MFNWIFKKPSDEFSQEIYRILDYRPKNKSLFHAACTPPQYNSKSNYERLEFLGDAVIDLIVSIFLFKKYVNKDEGFLTSMRSKIVNHKQLFFLAQKLNLIKLVQISLKTQNIVISQPLSNYISDIFESLIGALYIDKGYNYTEQWLIREVLIPYINFEELEEKDVNIKNTLFAWAAKYQRKIEFLLSNEQNIAHKKVFTIQCLLDQQVIAEGSAYNKKDASIIAAENALKYLEDTILKSS
ncbi:MAG: putative dsRNA-binding protein [Sediminibacterium sp.]|nr:putative dsRNA-binding protein [Sediminibacterium sp.]